MKPFYTRFCLFALILCLIFVSGCSSNDKDKKLSVNESLKTYNEELITKLKGAKEFNQVSDYLCKWAEKNDIKIKETADHHLVLLKTAAQNYENAETMTLHASVSFDSQTVFSEDLESVAIAMSTLYSAESHGTIRAVFTDALHGKPVGAGTVAEKYLKTDNLISLNYAKNPYIHNKLAGESNVIVSHKVKQTKPVYTKAYKIQFTGTASKSPYRYGGDYPNAIKTIGDLLASCKSGSVLFELASFTGGESSDLLPASATAVIVLQENDVESFTTRFENSFSKVEDAYNDLDEPFTYIMTECPLPAKVIRTKDTDVIVSLLYTLINGTYFKSDEGQILAGSSFGRTTFNKNTVNIYINAKSLDPEKMAEMLNIFQTTSGLCGAKYKKVNSTPIWTAGKDNLLVNDLAKELKLDPIGTLEDINSTVFLRKQSKLNLTMLGVNLDDGADCVEAIMTYMKGPETE